MLFLSLFKSLEGQSVLIELKNSLQLRGTLVSVDHYLNMKIDNVEVVDKESFPQLVRARRARRARGPRGTRTHAPSVPPCSSRSSPSLCAAA